MVLLQRILKKIFKSPVVVNVEGEWKTGKTDFALFAAELIKELGLVDEVATNIETFGAFTYISDLKSLKFWLHRNKEAKLYIFDELNVNAPARRAMSNKSVGIISILPECSKAHARVICIAQDVAGIDSEFKKKVWVKATFSKLITKKNKLKTVKVFSPTFLKHTYIFHDVPRTTIKFDPDLIAPFTLEPQDNSRIIKDENLAKLARWANGTSWREDFKYPLECNRFVRAQVKNLVSLYVLYTDNSVVGNAPKKGSDKI